MMQDFAYGADVSVVKQLSLGEAGTVVGLDLLPGTVLQHFFSREFQYGGSGSQIAEALPLAVEYDGGQGQSARRQFPLLSALAARHLLMVVFFENHEVQALQYAQAADTQGIYRQALAEKTAGDKRQLVKSLEQRGIAAVLTSPEKLTVAAVNRYLEYKSRGLL